jgi:hypothetical protein
MLSLFSLPIYSYFLYKKNIEIKTSGIETGTQYCFITLVGRYYVRCTSSCSHQIYIDTVESGLVHWFPAIPRWMPAI